MVRGKQIRDILTFNILEAERFHSIVCKGSRYPGLAPDKVGDLDSLGLLDGGDDLDGAAATPDYPNSLALKTLPKLVLCELNAFLGNTNGATYVSSHAAECTTGICKSLNPGISGQLISFSDPRALITTSALSTNSAPVARSSTVMNLGSCQCPRRA